MNTENREARSDEHMTMVSVRDVERMLGVTRHTFYPLEKSGEFPRRIAISYRHVVYRKSEIETYLDVLQSGKTWSEHVAEKAAAAELTQAELEEAAPRVQGGV